jgi:phosphoglycerate kinase
MTRQLNIKRLIASGLIFAFLGTSLQPVRAQELILPAPGTMVNLSPAYVPVLIKGLRVHPENPLLFDFILDTGRSGLKINSPKFKDESEKLIKYFLASLTIKEDDLWVNLSPYEKTRIVPEQLGQTELGRDMLAQDYILKQLAASLIYPEKQLGREFWNTVYAKAQQQFGVSDIPVNTFNKVWIISDKAKILERNNVGYVVGAHLKVMLEEDYLALKKHTTINQVSNTHTVASQVVRQIIIPALDKEVNQGQNFVSLRQMFYSMILASWYKLALKDTLLNQVYSNKGKTGGVLSDDPTAKEKIFEQYLRAYKKGVFNYIKEDMNTAGQQSMPRKYFSGGERIFQIPPQKLIQREQNLGPGDNASPDGDLAMATVNMTEQTYDTAMRTAEVENPPMIYEALSKLSSIITHEPNINPAIYDQIQNAIAELEGNYLLLSPEKLEQRISALETGLGLLFGPTIHEHGTLSSEHALSTLLIAALKATAKVSNLLTPQNKPPRAIAWQNVTEDRTTLPNHLIFTFQRPHGSRIGLAVPLLTAAPPQDFVIPLIKAEDRSLAERLLIIQTISTELLKFATFDPQALKQLYLPQDATPEEIHAAYKMMYGFAWSIAEHYGLASSPNAERDKSAEDMTARIQNDILWPTTVRISQLRILGEWYSTHPVSSTVIAFLAAANEPATRGEAIPDAISNAAIDALFQIYSSLSEVERIRATTYLTGLASEVIKAPALFWLQRPMGYFLHVSQRLQRYKNEAGNNTIVMDSAMIGKYVTLDEVSVSGKRVLIRPDINAPVSNGKISLTERITAAAVTIKEAAESGAKVTVIAHQGRPGDSDYLESLEQHAKLLSELIGRPVQYVNDLYGQEAVEAIKALKDGEVLLLKNVRPQEKEPQFVSILEPLFDYFILDGFSVAHRATNSVTGFTNIPNLAGRLMEKEWNGNERFLTEIVHPYVELLGGSKISDHIDALKYGLEQGLIDHVLTGGMLGQLLLIIKGYHLGEATTQVLRKQDVDPKERPDGLLSLIPALTSIYESYKDKIETPTDLAYEDGNGQRQEISVDALGTNGVPFVLADNGTQTANHYAEILKEAKTAFIKGPQGNYKRETMRKASQVTFKAVAESGAYWMTGGGDTDKLVDELDLTPSHRTLAGGAFLEFKAGKELPGIKRLRESAEADRAALAEPGGIDLNAKNMGLDIFKEGQGVEMKFNPAMVAEFQRGDFSGIVANIIRIVPIKSALPMMGLEASPV